MPAAIVIAIRVLLPLTILRWPLAGGVLCLVVDAVDVILVDALSRVLGGSPEFGPFYAQIDKWLDTWYLAFELWVSRRWPEAMLRGTVGALFLWRLAGVIAFEITAVRPLLLVFPNLFENVYLYVQAARRFAPRFLPKTYPQLLLVLVILFIPKAIQEYVLHFEQLHPWQWLRDTLIRPVLGDD